ncbi:MAG: aldehyde ferredoxin oxidoreductase family protein [Candidatus Thermoplasmatota archaeon]
MRYKGYAGKLLRINLEKNSIKAFQLNNELIENYIGGAGFCSYFLFKELDCSEPLSSKNKIMFATGPFTGTLWPQGSRYTVAALSPLTNCWGEAHSAGYWGAELKYAGYDGIIVEGKARKPVYIRIEDDDISIKNAEHIWGKNTNETEKIIREEMHGAKVACIGVAGEKKVLISCIMNDLDRAAARSGIGAVMGSKNLKAIAVRGTKEIEVWDIENYLDTMHSLIEKMLSDPLTNSRIKYGTTGLVELMNEIARLPTYNLKTGVFEYADHICGDAVIKYLIKPRADFACTQRCGRYTCIKNGKYSYIGGGPEYESLSSLGSRCGNRNLESILYAHHLCNLYGLDTIGVGATISWAMECFEKKLLDKKIIGELDLTWGNDDTIIKLIHQIANREGFGNILADGSYRAALKLGVGLDYVMHVKKQEIAGQDGRAQKSMGLAMAVAPRGADHLYAFPVLDEVGYEEKIKVVYGEEYLPEIADKLSPKHKGYMIYVNENFAALIEALGACKYGTMIPPALYYDEVKIGLKVTTGLDYSIEELKKIGERIVNLNRMFNVRLGLSRKDDTLPKRMLYEKAPDGAAKGEVVELDYMLDDYYKIRGWDKNGLPKEKKLKELGLDFAISRR